MQESLSTMVGAEVVLAGVHKRFSTFTAIDDLDLTIRRGEFISLLGPSGSGKSTLLMLIAGFERLTRGEISINDRRVSAVPPHKRDIGMVFQSYALFPHLTVAENVAFALKQRRVDRAETARRVADVLDLVKLSELSGRFPQQLSGGQQQRVAIARAIIFNPPVLLMDEPLSALDKQLREEMQLEIKRLHDRLGITFIYVTHDQKEALVMSDRVAVLNRGRIEQIGAPTELYDEPANVFVASFIGEANFLDAKVVGAEPGLSVLATAGGLVRGPASSCTRLMVRPEKIAVLRPGGTAAAPALNMLPGTVRETIFMGEMLRYVVALADGQTLSAKHQHRADVPVLAPGEPAVVAWAVADTRLV